VIVRTESSSRSPQPIDLPDALGCEASNLLTTLQSSTMDRFRVLGVGCDPNLDWPACDTPEGIPEHRAESYPREGTKLPIVKFISVHLGGHNEASFRGEGLELA
jgi:hypothetical protein